MDSETRGLALNRVLLRRYPTRKQGSVVNGFRQEGTMKRQRLLIALTVVNLALLILSPVRPHPVVAQDGEPVRRGRALQIVDEHGRVRASISVYPADPNVKMPDGTTGYPETVLLRLISSKGGPNIKIAATEDGSAMVLGGDSNPTHIQLLARGTNTSFKLTNKDGRQQLIKP